MCNCAHQIFGNIGYSERKKINDDDEDEEEKEDEDEDDEEEEEEGNNINEEEDKEEKNKDKEDKEDKDKDKNRFEATWPTLARDGRRGKCCQTLNANSSFISVNKDGTGNLEEHSCNCKMQGLCVQCCLKKWFGKFG